MLLYMCILYLHSLVFNIYGIKCVALFCFYFITFFIIYGIIILLTVYCSFIHVTIIIGSVTSSHFFFQAQDGLRCRDEKDSEDVG